MGEDFEIKYKNTDIGRCGNISYEFGVDKYSSFITLTGSSFSPEFAPDDSAEVVDIQTLRFHRALSPQEKENIIEIIQETYLDFEKCKTEVFKFKYMLEKKESEGV